MIMSKEMNLSDCHAGKPRESDLRTRPCDNTWRVEAFGSRWHAALLAGSDVHAAVPFASKCQVGWAVLVFHESLDPRTLEDFDIFRLRFGKKAPDAFIRARPAPLPRELRHGPGGTGTAVAECASLKLRGSQPPEPHEHLER